MRGVVWALSVTAGAMCVMLAVTPPYGARTGMCAFLAFVLSHLAILVATGDRQR